MTEMPMFDDPVPPQHQPPKRKPRKPMKKRRKTRKTAPSIADLAVRAAVGRPKKRRKAKKARANGHAGGRYTKAQYSAIGTLLEMSVKERTAVLDIVKGLSK